MKYSNLVRYILNLLLIAGVILLVVLQGRTSKPETLVEVGSSLQSEVSTADLITFFPDVAQVQQVDSLWQEVYNSAGELLGYAIYSSPYTDKVYGFGGSTPLVIALDTDERILGTAILANNETESYLNRVTQKGIFDAWNGLTIPEAVNKKVDGVTGATLTSTAVVRTFQQRMSLFSERGLNKQIDYWTWVKSICSLLIIGLALFFYFKPQKGKRFRVYYLGLCIVVLGFWQGLFISAAGLYGWLVNGIPFSVQPAVMLFVLIVLLSVVLPMITRKQFYCIWVCPYGAAQELAGKLNKDKINIPPSWLKVLVQMRKYILMFVIFLVLLGVVTDLSQIEPFSAFNFQAASSVVLILAGVFLILSTVINKPWCRFFCPTGQILDTFRACSIKNIRQDEE